MDCFRIAPLGLLLAAAGFSAPMQSQAVSSQPPQQDASAWHPIPPAAPVHAPFPIKAKVPYTVDILPATAVSAQDQQLESNEENSIRERAGMRLMDFAPGGWSYSQIVCPAFPGHLFLRFMRTAGQGDVSAFTASIPRFGQGKDRIIPIQRRGYSLFSPAPINAMTIASFNHILAEERTSGEPDWAAIAVCYAALAGTGNEGILAPVGGPILQLQSDGGATIIIATTDPHAKDWTMIFDRNGVLKKAIHTGVADYTVHPVPKAGQAQWQPVAGSYVSDAAKAVPPPQ
ncbi:hypothetical protein [Terracidiphilus gabretensis]|jgi:hypothetical protein|uniref:hypothetical protein n=1 Tax=Terracidiphilus gabretensis TaxID=1577687 RepID=UPI00071B16EF|nr:hypothetical protein [Terracidiphilus gabretensis]